ncbi:MAG: hypothetical protein IPM93_21710 [Candidatus Obscuribacter sp.]|nr:hypothetical protein [Candidatus Obscuribacter sp.]
MHAEDENLKVPALQNTGHEPLNTITFSMYHPTLRALHYGLFRSSVPGLSMADGVLSA